jgi:molybdenum cofactor cytidylyltransferase
VRSNLDNAHSRDALGGAVAGVLLAAGSSKRMLGVNKLFVRIEDEPAVVRICSVALETELDPVMVVLGHEQVEVRSALDPLRANHSRIRFVVNPDYREGRITSIMAAVRALPSECGAAMFLRGDQPWITKILISDLIKILRKEKASLAFPVYNGRKGSPTVFARSQFNRLLALKGDQGTLGLVEELWGEAAKMEVDDPRCLMGIDTREDLDSLLL